MSDSVVQDVVAEASRLREPGVRSRRRDASATRMFSMAFLLTIAALGIWVFAFAMLASITEELFFARPSSSRVSHLLFREDGLPVWKTTDYSQGSDRLEYHDLDD